MTFINDANYSPPLTLLLRHEMKSLFILTKSIWLRLNKQWFIQNTLQFNFNFNKTFLPQRAWAKVSGAEDLTLNSLIFSKKLSLHDFPCKVKEDNKKLKENNLKFTMWSAYMQINVMFCPLSWSDVLLCCTVCDLMYIWSHVDITLNSSSGM